MPSVISIDLQYRVLYVKAGERPSLRIGRTGDAGHQTSPNFTPNGRCKMVLISPQYVREFPLIPGGGLFFVPVGICIALSSFLPRLRMALVWVGIALGVLAIGLGGRFVKGLPPPSGLQVAFFVVAIVAEAIAFRFLIPRLRPLGERQVVVGTLAIVGAHFLVMIPAFGLPILILALFCLTNAGIAYRIPRYPMTAAWLLDGIFKVATGVTMWMASPAFGALR